MKMMKRSKKMIKRSRLHDRVERYFRRRRRKNRGE
jgi:hypothetical protein